MIEALQRLKNDEVIGVPTETVYGLAALCSSQKAIEHIFRLKGRPRTRALPVQIASLEMLPLVAGEIPEIFWELYAPHMPGPLTVVLKKSPDFPSWVTHGEESVAVRIPQNPTMFRLLKEIKEPLAVTSANLSGSPALLSADGVRMAFPQIYTLDGGEVTHGQASTIVSLVDPDQPKLLRSGPLGFPLTSQRSASHISSRS